MLLQVCSAVSYAHSRGILHRDLKPDNVMIGSFEEVLVLDWGLAASTDELEEVWIPRASEQDRPAGTPAYMAPEMVGDPSWAREHGIPLLERPPVGGVSERSDVFLLGALLYQILAGRPPHLGPDVNAVLAQAWLCELRPPPGPEGLVSVVMRAMRRAPNERHRSAREFRDALRAHLELQSALGAAELALSRGDAEGARQTLDSIELPPSGLVERVEALEARLREREEQRQLWSPERNKFVRRYLVGSMGLVFGLVHLLGHFRPDWATYEVALGSTFAFLVLALGASFAARRQLIPSRAK